MVADGAFQRQLSHAHPRDSQDELASEDFWSSRRNLAQRDQISVCRELDGVQYQVGIRGLLHAGNSRTSLQLPFDRVSAYRVS